MSSLLLTLKLFLEFDDLLISQNLAYDQKQLQKDEQCM
jgi:hypothetical protein